MKITIDIPQEFINHFEQDRFADSLKRLKSDAHLLAGNYEEELMDMLIIAFKNAKKEDDLSYGIITYIAAGMILGMVIMFVILAFGNM